MQRIVFIFLSLLILSASSISATGDDEKTLLKFYGGVDLLTTEKASSEIITAATSTTLKMNGGLGCGVQFLVPLDPKVSVGAEVGYIFTTFEQKSTALYNGSSTPAKNYVAFSPIAAILNYRFGYLYLQGGIGLSVYRSMVKFENAAPNHQSVTSSDVQTGGCALIGTGAAVPIFGFMGIDLSIKYYSTFVTINGQTSNDALFMPTAAVFFQF